MATNFWTSSHCKTLCTKEALLAGHSADGAKGLTADQVQQLTIFHVQYICDLARALQLMTRQRAVATACVYFRRFSATHDFCQHDPRLIAPACLYLACKAEESQLQAKLLFYAMRKVADKYVGMLVMDAKQLTDMELLVLEGLNFRLAVFHPYDDLLAFLRDAQLTDITQCAWAIVNDSLRTDVSLLYPPHIIALGCLSLAAVLMQKEMRPWLEGVDVDLNQVYQVTNELVHMYRDYRDPISAETCCQMMSILQRTA